MALSLSDQKMLAAAIGQVLRPLIARVAALEAQLAAIEQSGLKGFADLHRGPWREGETYRRSELCAHNGGLWLARANTSARPGEPGAGWELIVKAPRHDSGRANGARA